jgi:hypothetical protein
LHAGCRSSEPACAHLLLVLRPTADGRCGSV